MIVITMLFICIVTAVSVSGCSLATITWNGQVVIVNEDATKIHVWISDSSDRTWQGAPSNGIEPGKTMTIKTETNVDSDEAKPLYLFAGRNGQVLSSTKITPTSDGFDYRFSWDGTKFTL